MVSLRLIFLIFLVVSAFSSSLGQDDLDNVCDEPSILVVVFNPVDDIAEIQCFIPTGESETLLTEAGIGSLSPDGSHIAYTTTNSSGASLFEYKMSLYVHEIETGHSRQLRDGDGHISANWITANDLIISTWDDRITASAAFRPSQRFLYNLQSDELIELDWPVGNGARVVGYWLEENSFLFANYSDGLSQITLDGTLTPVQLPLVASDSNFVMSSDGRSVAYQTKCENEDVLANCIAVYELGTDNVEIITAFAEDYESLSYFTFSPTGRFVAISLQQQSVIGIYDLEQKVITFELSEMDANGFVWERDQDRLFVAVVDEDDEQDNLSYIYVVNPLSGEMELAMPEPIWWLGFCPNS